MKGLIVFKVASNRYALDIENIQRIIQAIELTDIPNTHPLVDGMMSYEDGVIKVLNFRKLIGIASYEDELHQLFEKLKISHEDWVEALKISVKNGSEFQKTTSPHKCELGMWIDGFTSYNEEVSAVLSNLVNHHKQLHILAVKALEIRENDPQAAQTIIDVEVGSVFQSTKSALDIFTNKLDKISNSLQKLVIYENNGQKFAVKVDSIEDITHIEESLIKNSDNHHDVNEFLELEGVLDLNGVLINVIKELNIPK